MDKTIVILSAIVAVLFLPSMAYGTFINVPPSMFPAGEVYYYNPTGTTVTIIAQSDGYTNMVKAAPTTSFISTMDFDNGGANDSTLRYTGGITKFFHIACSISMSATNPNDQFVYAVAKNGVPLDSSKIIMKLGGVSDTLSSAMHVFIELDPGDEIEFYVGNMSGSGNAVVKTINFVAISMH